ncbi:MAG: GNAT family N-acetyltransferase [Caulobacterales bacterium]
MEATPPRKRPGAAPPAVRFRPAALGDAAMLQRWLAEPHVRRFYREPFETLGALIDYYGPAIRGEEPTLCHIALGDGAPFGFIQCYRNLAYPDYARLIGAEEGISIDLYIGEPDFVGKGFGRAMLLAYLTDVAFPAYPGEPTAYIAHELDNAAALNCSRSVGFQPLRRVLEDGVWDQLLVLRREDLERTKGPAEVA